MQSQVVSIPAREIVDWETCHDVFSEALGFPEYYGRNMDAWIDCLTYADLEGGGMIAKPVKYGDLLTLSMLDADEFKQRRPKQFSALIECTAFVNYRRRELGDAPILALLLDGRFA